MPRKKLDCRACGACCVIPEPEANGGWIPLTEADLKRLSPYYRRRKVVRGWHRGRESHPLLKVKPLDGRGFACVAFQGQVGGPCRCLIYDRRPAICRDYKPGTDYCRETRFLEDMSDA